MRKGQRRNEVKMLNIPSRDEAEALVIWAEKQNPGNWVAHSRMAAAAAEKIAKEAGLNSEKAYILGLLHDIGRFEGVRGLHHTIAGYELMMEKGFDACARICLTHSFPIKVLEAFSGKKDCTDEEQAFIRDFLEKTEYDDYDRLMQLCDAIALPEGITLMDSRLMDVGLRHGFNELTLPKWRAFYEIKKMFDEKCGCNLYKLLQPEIEKTIFA